MWSWFGDTQEGLTAKTRGLTPPHILTWSSGSSTALSAHALNIDGLGLSDPKSCCHFSLYLVCVVVTVESKNSAHARAQSSQLLTGQGATSDWGPVAEGGNPCNQGCPTTVRYYWENLSSGRASPSGINRCGIDILIVSHFSLIGIYAFILCHRSLVKNRFFELNDGLCMELGICYYN